MPCSSSHAIARAFAVAMFGAIGAGVDRLNHGWTTLYRADRPRQARRRGRRQRTRPRSSLTADDVADAPSSFKETLVFSSSSRSRPRALMCASAFAEVSSVPSALYRASSKSLSKSGSSSSRGGSPASVRMRRMRRRYRAARASPRRVEACCADDRSRRSQTAIEGCSGQARGRSTTRAGRGTVSVTRGGCGPWRRRTPHPPRAERQRRSTRRLRMAIMEEQGACRPGCAAMPSAFGLAPHDVAADDVWRPRSPCTLSWCSTLGPEAHGAAREPVTHRCRRQPLNMTTRCSNAHAQLSRRPDPRTYSGSLDGTGTAVRVGRVPDTGRSCGARRGAPGTFP